MAGYGGRCGRGVGRVFPQWRRRRGMALERGSNNVCRPTSPTPRSQPKVFQMLPDHTIHHISAPLPVRTVFKGDASLPLFFCLRVAPLSFLPTLRRGGLDGRRRSCMPASFGFEFSERRRIHNTYTRRITFVAKNCLLRRERESTGIYRK